MLRKEGCFSCSVSQKSSSYKFGLWREVQLNFQIKLHVRDFPILLGIQHSLGGIGIISSNQSSCAFRIRKLNELIELVKFRRFDQYPGISLLRKEKEEIIYYLSILYLLCN